MSNKRFNIYNAGEDFTIESSDKIVIELGKLHVACMITDTPKKSIKAFELFDFTESEASNPEDLYLSIVLYSKILGKSTVAAEVYINNEWCLSVPIYKFNKEIAIDYINTVFGHDASAKIYFEHLPIEPGIMNVFRVNEKHFLFLKPLSAVTFHHTYSNIIRRYATSASDLPSQFISVRFYNTYIVAIVMKEGKLQLIQSFTYETPEDVLYYLLNLSDRFQLYSNELTLQISGLIDLEFKLYRELLKYFKQVLIDNVNQSVISINNELPLHYFTPFFNLAI